MVSVVSKINTDSAENLIFFIIVMLNISDGPLIRLTIFVKLIIERLIAIGRWRKYVKANHLKRESFLILPELNLKIIRALIKEAHLNCAR